MSTCFDRVDDWSAECWAELFEQIYAVFHPGSIGFVESGEPFLEVGRADNGLRHWVNIGHFLYRRNPMSRVSPKRARGLRGRKQDHCVKDLREFHEFLAAVASRMTL